MSETLLSVGIDIGTSTTQLILSRLTLANRANPFSVPRIAIEDREVLYRSGIHFTPLLSDTVIDAEGVRTIVAEEYRKSGFAPEQVDTGGGDHHRRDRSQGKRPGGALRPLPVRRGLCGSHRRAGSGVHSGRPGGGRG